MKKTLIKKDDILIKTDIENLIYINNRIYYNGIKQKGLSLFIDKLLKKDHNKIRETIDNIEYDIYPISELNSYLKFYYDFGILYDDKFFFVARNFY